MKGLAEPRDGAGPCPVALGSTFTWRLRAFSDGDYPGAVNTLHGRIIDVNATHRHYTAEAECNGYRLRESFKF